MRHIFARRPTRLAVLGRRVIARRRTLLVISEGDPTARNILVAATMRTTKPNWGSTAHVLLSGIRWWSRPVVMAITVTALLADRHGHVGTSPLAATAVFVAVATSPLLTSLRVRLGDRAMAKRAAVLMPEIREQLDRVTVLHDFGLPRTGGRADTATDDLAAVGDALSFGGLPTIVAQPCCVEAGELYAAWAGALLVPRHAHVERMLLIFARSSDTRRGESLASRDADIVALDRVVRARHEHRQLALI
jgi:hypothetical protein